MSFKIGLALGGGAARGLAHLGVIKALNKAGISIDIVSGTSIGAIVAAVYGANPDIDAATRTVADYLGSSDFDRTRLELIKESALEPKGYFGTLKKYVKTGLFFAVSLRKKSFISEEAFRRNLENILPQGNIEDLPVKVGLVSMNLDTAEQEISTSGEIIQKVMASCSIPGVFPPIQFNDSKFVDGSWINPVPVSVARELGAEFVIAVDVAPGMDQTQKEMNGIDVTLKAAEGSRHSLKEICLSQADIPLSVDLMHMHWADFTQIETCLEAGEKTVEDSIDKIKKKLFWMKFKKRLFL
jgi:NTE family protein